MLHIIPISASFVTREKNPDNLYGISLSIFICFLLQFSFGSGEGIFYHVYSANV